MQSPVPFPDQYSARGQVRPLPVQALEAVRHGDDEFFDIVKWVHFALLNAEELGVDSKSVASAATSTKADVRRLDGAEGGLGESLGLSNDFAAKAIRAVGNYGEVFRGMEVADKIVAAPRDDCNNPLELITMTLTVKD